MAKSLGRFSVWCSHPVCRAAGSPVGGQWKRKLRGDAPLPIPDGRAILLFAPCQKRADFRRFATRAGEEFEFST
jgi:hypothetical protein